MDNGEILNLIKEKEEQEYFKRMDEHKKLYALEKYVMKVNDTEVPDIINITLPGPQTFADYIISLCSGSVQQIEVEGKKLFSGQAEDIENILNAVVDAAGERLSNMEYPDLNSFDFSMACLRGRVARRILLRKEKDKFISDILPCDTRFLAYDVSTDGLEWASYRLSKTKAQIKAGAAKYNKIKTENLFNGGPSTNEFEVRDYWNKEKHIIFISDEIAHEEDNPFGEVPYVTVVCNVGNNLLDVDMRKYKGNSVYSGVADLYPELNRVVSTLATLNVRTIEGNLQYKSLKGEQAELPDDPPQGMRRIFAVEKDGGYFSMPLEDIRQATTMLWNILEQCKQEATVASSKYGNLEFSLSAVALNKLSSETDKVLYPRIEAVANLNIKSARMMIRQLKDIGGNIEIGDYGNFDTSALKGDYKIKYTYNQTDPQRDTANLSLANAAEKYYSPDTIRRDILKVQDPNAEAAKIRIAKYEAVGADNMSDSELYQVVHDLRDVERNVEAELALQSLEKRLRDRNNPQMQPAQGAKIPTPTGQQGGKSILPLTDESSRQGGKQTSITEMK